MSDKEPEVVETLDSSVEISDGSENATVDNDETQELNIKDVNLSEDEMKYPGKTREEIKQIKARKTIRKRKNKQAKKSRRKNRK